MAAGLRCEASGAALSVACAALHAGDAAPARWERCLSLAEEWPDRLRFDSHLSFDHDRAAVRDAVLTVVGALRGRGGAAAGLTALALVKGVGGNSGWAEVWRTEREALRRDDDPDTAEAALLAGPPSPW